MRPLIGIPTIAYPAGEYTPTRFVLNQTYANAILAAGGAPVLLPITKEPKVVRAFFSQLQGILFAGGADIAGKWYGGAAGGDPELERDEMEITLARLAYKHNLPTLGICRGEQLMNVALGGTLYQDIGTQRKGQRHTSETRTGAAHGVAIDPASLLHAIIDEESLEVNSLHHQAVDRLAKNLLPTAYADDRLVEAFESPEHPYWLAVQWHPEELGDTASKKLFDSFVNAASAVRRS